MINILFTKSKNFQKQLSSYLDSRKPNDKLKTKIVKQIISEVKKIEINLQSNMKKGLVNLKNYQKIILFLANQK